MTGEGFGEGVSSKASGSTTQGGTDSEGSHFTAASGQCVFVCVCGGVQMTVVWTNIGGGGKRGGGGGGDRDKGSVDFKLAHLHVHASV